MVVRRISASKYLLGGVENGFLVSVQNDRIYFGQDLVPKSLMSNQNMGLSCDCLSVFLLMPTFGRVYSYAFSIAMFYESMFEDILV